MSTPCSGCGLDIAGGDASCQQLFDETAARELSDFRLARHHRTRVDAYCLQHPARYTVSAKSLMAHLGGLCVAHEHGGDERAYRALQRSLNGAPVLDRPPIPGARGALTLDALIAARDPDAYSAAVAVWARSVWDAYAPLHGFARDWLARAITATSTAPRPRSTR